MRKLTSFLFVSLDGVVESPNKFVRGAVFDDITALIHETIADQDTVLLGRQMYAEWSKYWPDSTVQPFSTFINDTPKLVVSRTLQEVTWRNSSLLAGDLSAAIATLKRQPGKTIGVHGSIRLTQSLLLAGMLDELRFIQFPVIAGSGRRLLEHGGSPIQLDLQASSHATPAGLQYLVYTPRAPDSVVAARL